MPPLPAGMYKGHDEHDGFHDEHGGFQVGDQPGDRMIGSRE